MAVKALNFKMDEVEIADVKRVASVYHMTVTDVVKEAIREYLEKLKAAPFYRLTANVQEADEAESVGRGDGSLVPLLYRDLDKGRACAKTSRQAPTCRSGDRNSDRGGDYQSPRLS